MSHFFSMGGYGVYIWPCYILSFVLLVGIGRRRYRLVKKLRLLTQQKSSLSERNRG